MKLSSRTDWSVEEARLQDDFPSLPLSVGQDGLRSIVGLLEVVPDVSYTVDLRIPPDYPKVEPRLFCNPQEIPWKLDRHVYEQNGLACLCARIEIRRHWPWGSDLTDFVSTLVKPFFLWQFYFETHGVSPPTGARSHFGPGILEAAQDMLNSLGNVTDGQIKEFLRLLSRKNAPRGHEACPCGSGLKLRNCHSDLMRILRTQVDPRHAAADLAEAFRS